MSIIDTLITDRTQADVNRALALSAKGWAAMTAAEREEFAAGMKGTYNATDLNRVNAAMEYLDTRLKAMGYTGGYYQRVKVPHQQSGGGSVLPEGYTQVAYIQSDGNQYVDTGFKPNQDTRVVMDFELLSVTGQYADPIFGVRTSASAAGYYFWASGTAVATEQYQSGYNSGSTYPAVTRVGRHTVDKNKNVTTVDGVTTEAAYAAFTTAWNMLLFQSYNNGNLYSQTTKMRLYSCQTYDNDTFIRDYIPCIDPSGEVGLYDTVDGLFYGNDGTGAFVAGPAYGDYRYLKMQINAIRSSGGIQMSEIRLVNDDGSFFQWPSSTNVQSDIGASSGSEGPGNLIDGLLTTKYYTPSFWPGGSITIDLGEGEYVNLLEFSKWQYYTANDMPDRDPVSFSFQVSNDGDIWSVVDDVTGEDITQDREALAYTGSTTTIFPQSPEAELDPYTWYKEDIPTPEAMEEYLDNVRRFRSAKPPFATTPQVPEDMVLATIDEWNDIEQILVDIETSLISIAKAAIYAGTPYIFAGGPMIYATGG